MYIYIYSDIQFRRHKSLFGPIPMEILTNVRSQSVTITLILSFKLMICCDSKCMYLWNIIVLWTDCIKPVISIVFKFTALFVIYCSVCFFIGLASNWSHSLCIFLVFLSLLLYSYSHSHYTLFLPTITCSPSEVPIMNKRTTKCFPVLSHISPVPFYCLKE
jgi:hypothetical protein